VLLAAAAALAIVVEDRAGLRAAPRAGAPQLAALWQGEVLELRGERAEYLKVYDYRRERGGYLKRDAVSPIGLSEADAPGLLALLRFLRDRPGSEALGISYGAAYLKAVPPQALTAEPFDAIAGMAERLADAASGSGTPRTAVAAHLEVVEQFGIHTQSFERNGRIQLCYDGELYRRVLAMPAATPEQRARAALGLTRPDCIDRAMGLVLREGEDQEHARLLEGIDERGVTALTLSRVHARRAAVWAAVAYDEARHGAPAGAAAQRALSELLAVRPEDLGEDRRPEYVDAVVRVGAIRWATVPVLPQPGPLTLVTVPGQPGQTCIELEATTVTARPDAPLVRRCTWGVVWMASAQSIAQGRMLVLAVQPLECWRELWVFHTRAGVWTVDVVSPGLDDPEEGYVDFAGYAPGARRLLIAREVKESGRFHRRFEELRLDDLALARQANTPELLPDFGRWQDVGWRRDTLAMH
jgi:hypothetical protein